MIEDYTYLMHLTARQLVERARMATGLTTSAAQLMRALADTLDTTDHLCDELDAANAGLQADLDATSQERDEWRDEAHALQRQIARGPTP